MFTIFHLFEVVGAVAGLAGGMALGHRGYGWVGLALGGAVGFFTGRILGSIPCTITSVILNRDLKRCDVVTLRGRLDREYYIAHLIIAHLLVRGEPIESFGSYVSELLGSNCPDRRRFGGHILRIWPETATPTASSAGSVPTGPQALSQE